MLRVSDHFSDSDLGRQRRGNEDSYFVRSPLFVVADGMGGAQAGEVASQMAVEAFDGGLPGEGDPAGALVELIAGANRRIHRTSVQEEGRQGMGTTVTAAYVGEDDVTIAHVGDSRAYLLRRGELTRLTRDHSLVGELVERGKLTEEQAEQHPQRSVITRALGPEPDVAVDTETYPAKDGDLFLLCSDGLTSMVPEARLAPILTGADSLADAGRRLITAANDAGGRDNITVLLFRLEEIGPGPGGRAVATEQPTMAGEDALRTEDVRRAAREGGQASSVALADPPSARTAPLPEPSPGPPPAPGTARRRRRRVPPAAIALFVIAIPVISGMLLAMRAVYFIGTDPNDGRTLTVFRGLPYELPGGLKLYTRYGGSGVTFDAVPATRRDVFTDHKLRTRDDAIGLVDELELGRVAP
jgi:serine/threonine protein phosphatase PrpC